MLAQIKDGKDGKGGKGDGDHGEGDKMIMDMVIKPLAKEHGIDKETIMMVKEMDDDARDEWCLDNKEFCDAVEAGTEKLVSEHEQEHGKHDDHADHMQLIMEEVVKPLAEAHGIDRKEIKAWMQMDDKKADKWCQKNEDFCTSVHEGLEALFPDMEDEDKHDSTKDDPTDN